MRRIVLDMQTALFSEAVSDALDKSDPDFCVYCAESVEQAEALCRSCRAYALITEVTRRHPRTLEDRIALGKAVKAKVPSCKTVLLIDENANPELAAKVRQTKKDGLVDNFIYGSVSPTYLAAVIDAL